MVRNVVVRGKWGEGVTGPLDRLASCPGWGSKLQLNLLINTDTKGTWKSIHIMEVSVLQR